MESNLMVDSVPVIGYDDQTRFPSEHSFDCLYSLIHASLVDALEPAISQDFLFSVCNILSDSQHPPIDPALKLLPAVLRCLTHSWRLFPPELRSPLDLALELAALVNHTSSLSVGPRLRRDDVVLPPDQPIGAIPKSGDHLPKVPSNKLDPAAYRNGCCACRRPRTVIKNPPTLDRVKVLPRERKLLVRSRPPSKKASSRPGDENVPPGESSRTPIKSNAVAHLVRATPLSGFSSSFNIAANLENFTLRETPIDIPSRLYHNADLPSTSRKTKPRANLGHKRL